VVRIYQLDLLFVYTLWWSVLLGDSGSAEYGRFCSSWDRCADQVPSLGESQTLKASNGSDVYYISSIFYYCAIV
jgi:hypothetical protein